MLHSCNSNKNKNKNKNNNKNTTTSTATATAATATAAAAAAAAAAATTIKNNSETYKAHASGFSISNRTAGDLLITAGDLILQ